MPNAPQFDEAGVRQSVKQIIVDNEAILLHGLEHFGQQREVGQVTSTPLTPLIGKYYIQVFTPRSRNEPVGRSGTGRKQPTQNVYTVVITIGDEAQVARGEIQAYETIHDTFTTFTDRLVNLFQGKDDAGVVLVSPRSRFRAGALVEKIDLSSPVYDKTRRLWAALWAEIRFELVQQC